MKEQCLGFSHAIGRLQKLAKAHLYSIEAS